MQSYNYTEWQYKMLTLLLINSLSEPAVFDTNEERPWNWPPDKFPPWTLKCPVNKYDGNLIQLF